MFRTKLESPVATKLLFGAIAAALNLQEPEENSFTLNTWKEIVNESRAYFFSS